VRDGELQTHTAARAHTSLEDQKKHDNNNMMRKKNKKKKKGSAGCGRSAWRSFAWRSRLRMLSEIVVKRCAITAHKN
jgi:hypothetical protein